MGNTPYPKFTFEGFKVLEEQEEYDGWNPCEYFEWIKRAAEQGYAEAQFEFALCYDDEDTIEEAVEWYRKAAEQGHIEAQYNLGVCYDNGDGVRKN